IPEAMMPLPDPTFTVNRTDDPVVPTSAPGVPDPTKFCNGAANDCSLREAVIKANLTPGTDTISIPAGIYTLTQPRSAADHHSSLSGTLEVQDSVNIVGAAASTTIIQGGLSLASSVDKVFSFNQDIDSFTNATVSVSNVTIQFGNNHGDVNIFDGWG